MITFYYLHKFYYRTNVKRGGQLATWVFIAILFAVLWGLQFLLAHFQVKNYYRTIREMSLRESGYLGVGKSKKRFGKGVVVVLVSDENDIVVDAKKMEGVTVFSRFDEFSDVVDEKLSNLLSFGAERALQEAILNAIEKIEITKGDKER